MGCQELIDFELNTINDNAFGTEDFEGRDLKELSVLEWFQFAKANKKFKEPGISAEELYALHEACEKAFGKNPINFVETGQCFGVTTRYFLIRILKYGGSLTSFEMKIREPFKEAMQRLNLWDRINVKGHSMRDNYSGGIDLLWIDSEHALEDALGEYMRFRTWLNGNCVVGFHDTECCVGVAKAIEMIQEVDELEVISACDNPSSAGCKLFRIKTRNRTDRNWNTRLRK